MMNEDEDEDSDFDDDDYDGAGSWTGSLAPDERMGIAEYCRLFGII